MKMNLAKFFLFSFFIFSFFLKLSEQKEITNRTLRVGFSPFPTWWEPCAFEKPITCSKPGSGIETLRLMEKFHGAKFELVYFKGFGVGASTETDTVTRGVMNGTVQLASNMLYVSCRNTYLFTLGVGGRNQNLWGGR